MLSGALGACVGETCTIPIDASKVRLQLQQTPPGQAPKYTGMLQTIMKVASEESVANLFRGLTPGLHRQFVNCSIRFGAYEHVRNMVTPSYVKPGEMTPLHTKILAAAITGSISICFANPFDVAKVRSQAIAREIGTNGPMPSALKVYGDILSREGFGGFYRGIQPNIIRNAMVNIGEMATYD